MAQIKIYGIRERLNPVKQKLSDTIHSCVVEAFQYPVDKRFHRFIPMERETSFIRKIALMLIRSLRSVSSREGRLKRRKSSFVCCSSESSSRWDQTERRGDHDIRNAEA